ncbi:unnamed protein product [Mytilus coruscus]|uniref:Cadherin domain-containing protein n=1 Tax=Mytilus coruscus TaxID=42192 RepID=A0A6J8E680_MYTCO|nr:unnamed protein product [Mytilus coruscus]
MASNNRVNGCICITHAEKTVRVMHISRVVFLLYCLVMSASGCDEWAQQNPCMCTCDDDNNECTERCKDIAAENEKVRCSEQCFMIAKTCWNSCASFNSSEKYLPKSHWNVVIRNETLSTDVLKVVATDPDNGVGGVVTYSLMDGGGLKGNATLIIKIQDIQNKPPYFTGQPFNAHIPEESPVGPCKDFFEIKSNGIYGIAKVTARLDRDHGIIQMLVAREEKAQPYNTQCIVHLAIIDRNDNLPKFIKSSFAVHIVENYTNEQLVLSEKAFDRDQRNTTNSRVEFALIDSPFNMQNFHNHHNMAK